MILFWTQLRLQLQEWLGARWFVLTLIVNEAIGPLAGLFVWRSVFPDNPQITTYFIGLIAVQMLTCSYEHHTFSEAVYQGHLSADLLKPQSPIVSLIAENTAVRLIMTTLALPLLLVCALVIGARFSPLAVLSALPALVLAAVLRFLFSWTIALASFWTNVVIMAATFGRTVVLLFGGSGFPVYAVDDPWRQVLMALPFFLMLGLPAEIAAGVLPADRWSHILIAQLAWVAAFALLAGLLWRRGLRSYTGAEL